jgi:hypothetical protein
MANPFEKGRFVADPEKDRIKVWQNPKSEKIKAGLEQIAAKFRESTVKKSNSQQPEDESRTIIVSSKKAPGRIVRVIDKKEAA